MSWQALYAQSYETWTPQFSITPFTTKVSFPLATIIKVQPSQTKLHRLAYDHTICVLCDSLHLFRLPHLVFYHRTLTSRRCLCHCDDEKMFETFILGRGMSCFKSGGFLKFDFDFDPDSFTTRDQLWFKEQAAYGSQRWRLLPHQSLLSFTWNVFRYLNQNVLKISSVLWYYGAIWPETAEPVNVRFLNGSLVMWRYHVVEALRMEGGPKVCLFLYFILLFRKPLSSQITHSQLPPITTGRLRHLHDATNTFVI